VPTSSKKKKAPFSVEGKGEEPAFFGWPSREEEAKPTEKRFSRVVRLKKRKVLSSAPRGRRGESMLSLPRLGKKRGTTEERKEERGLFPVAQKPAPPQPPVAPGKKGSLLPFLGKKGGVDPEENCCSEKSFVNRLDKKKGGGLPPYRKWKGTWERKKKGLFRPPGPPGKVDPFGAGGKKERGGSPYYRLGKKMKKKKLPSCTRTGGRGGGPPLLHPPSLKKGKKASYFHRKGKKGRPRKGAYLFRVERERGSLFILNRKKEKRTH